MNINKTVRYDRVVIAQWNAFVSFVTTPSFFEGVDRDCAAALCDKPESFKLRSPTANVTKNMANSSHVEKASGVNCYGMLII